MQMSFEPELKLGLYSKNCIVIFLLFIALKLLKEDSGFLPKRLCNVLGCKTEFLNKMLEQNVFYAG